MVDLDGRIDYSSIIVIKTNCGKNSNLTVFPNPISSQQDMLNLRFFPTQEKTSIQVIDMLGRVVKRISFTVEPNVVNTIQLDISDFTSGSYSLKVGNENSILLVILED
ncbi:MAG: T9SS type A sorting domain-containing protein [Saprospiraceae bacterium]